MKKNHIYIGFISVLFLMAGCHSPSTQEIIKNLNGYWEVKQVKNKDGKLKKVYKANPLVDFIQIDSSGHGQRVKLKPTIKGAFKTINLASHFTVDKQNDKLRFHYKTRLDTFTETLISSKKNEFTVRNSRGQTYTYTRFNLQKVMKAHGQ